MSNKAGGRAYKNGIMFHNDKYEVITKKTSEDEVEITVSEFAESKYSFNKIEGIPFIRPFIFYFKMLLDGWKGALITGFIGISLMYLIALIMVSSGNEVLLKKEQSSQVLSMMILLLLGVFFRFTDTAKYHGAEHMAISVLNKDLDITNDNIAKQSRISRYCGTNLVVFIFIIKIPLDFIGVNSWVSLLIGISIGFELFFLENKELRKLLSPIYFIGYTLQKHLLTAKPNKEQLDVARIGMLKLKELTDNHDKNLV